VATFLSGTSETTDRITRVTRGAREIAVLRATHEVERMPAEALERQWSAQDALLIAFKRELGVGFKHDGQDLTAPSCAGPRQLALIGLCDLGLPTARPR
jgi:hypothetical protein